MGWWSDCEGVHGWGGEVIVKVLLAMGSGGENSGFYPLQGGTYVYQATYDHISLHSNTP